MKNSKLTVKNRIANDTKLIDSELEFQNVVQSILQAGLTKTHFYSPLILNKHPIVTLINAFPIHENGNDNPD